jgi:hypothetical protein
MLVSVLTEDENIIKFFYDLYRGADKKDFEKGTELTFTASVKKQEVSKFSKCKETFVNRVTLPKEDK